MISDELNKIIEQIKSYGELSLRKKDAASEEQIVQFEETNKIRLPLQYKKWLGYSDGGDCYLPAGVQFYGVSHKPLIDPNEGDRPNDNYVVIGALSTGDPILFEKDKEQISIYNHEAGRIESDETYPDFFSFVKDLPEILGLGE